MMRFDDFVVVRLLTAPDAPTLSPADQAAIQDAHLAHLADLRDRGLLLAAGPASDPTGHVRGFALLTCTGDEAEELMSADPAVLAGRFLAECTGWEIPADLILAGSGPMPRSVADVLDG